MEQKKQLSVPDGWHEVTIEQFQEVASLTSEDVEKTIDTISIFLNEDPELIKKIDLDTLNKLISLLEWSNKLPDDAIYKPILDIDGEQYGLISKLEKLTIGEWFDLEHYVKDNAIQNIHFIMAILYRPLITAFNDRDRIIDDYDADLMPMRAELFKSKLKITDVYGTLVFFSLIEQEYMKIMLHYLKEEQVTMEMEMILEKQMKND